MKDYNDYKIKVDSVEIFGTQLETKSLVDCLSNTNIYLESLYKMFAELNFNLFEVLGQRNLSGLIGEIFSRFFCSEFDMCVLNPHPDGRPDILNLHGDGFRKYFETECFNLENNRRIPLKAKLTPFPHGGMEVKCTIGSPKANYKKLLFEKTGLNDFALGIPRIDYLDSFNYWAHHRHSTNLLCLYYDYYDMKAGIPQVLSLFLVKLTEDDWNVVSLGKTTAKKTSNTSLNKQGRIKLYSSCLAVIDDERYINKFKQVGIEL
jgi:hypothetical protein